jgi:hypothetical protein
VVTEIRIYFEGDKCLTPGFRAFLNEIFERARARRCKVNLIAAGGTPARDFDIAIRTHLDALNILLLDSDERPDGAQRTSAFIATQGWTNAHKDSIFWMVEMMEPWFHADKDALQRFYRDGFRREVMKPNPNVEQISKKDLEDGLKEATKNSKKGAYHKTKHAPSLLEAIKPNRVREAAPNCDRLFKIVLSRLA